MKKITDKGIDKGKTPVENNNRLPGDGKRRIEHQELSGRKGPKAEQIQALEALLTEREIECAELYAENIGLKQRLEEIDSSYAQSLVAQEPEQPNNHEEQVKRLRNQIRFEKLQAEVQEGFSKKPNKVQQDLQALRSEQKDKLELGAEERLMGRVRNLDIQLQERDNSILKYKLGMFFLSACFISYVCYENSTFAKELFKSVDMHKIQLFVQSNFVYLMNLLKDDYREFIATLRNADRVYFFMACRNTALTAFGIAFLIKLTFSIHKLLKTILEWRITPLLIAFGLLSYYRNV